MKFEADYFGLKRESDAAKLNKLANDPSIRPWIGGGAETLEFSNAVNDRDNYLLANEGGCLFFEKLDAGYYEVHTMFLPDWRGKKAVNTTNAALRWMFTKTDCLEIVTKVPDRNKAAKGLVRAIHGEFRFHRDAAWIDHKGDDGVSFYAMTLNSWAATDPNAAKAGKWFHDKLEAAKITKEAAHEVHADDHAHDQYVGATVEMLLSGNIQKALWFYNRWAKFAGYATVTVIAENPITLDIQDAILAVREQDFEVLLCR